MSTKLIKVGNSFNVPQKTYIANGTEERDNLNAYFGDLCLVIEDGTGITYIRSSYTDEDIREDPQKEKWYVYPTGGGGAGDVLSEAIAPSYTDTDTAYSINELIMYDGKLWRAKQAIPAPAGDFDPTKWEKVDIASTKADLIGGKVPASQLPSYVDDILEYENRAAFPQQGESGKIYIAIDTGYTYRWSGTEYIAIGTIFNEVHIGPNAPTGDETIWIKPEGQNQSATTIDSKEVGDWLYLNETVNGVTSLVRFLVISKDENTNTAIIAREGTTTPGFKVDTLDIEPIAEGEYDNAILAQYDQSVRNSSTVHYLTYWDPMTPEEDRDPRGVFRTLYRDLYDTDIVKELLILKADKITSGEDDQGYTSSIQPNNFESHNGLYAYLNTIDYSTTNNYFFQTEGFTDLYIAVALEVPLDTLLLGYDESFDPYANYVLKFKQNNIWNDLNDIRIATVAQLLALENRVIVLENRPAAAQSDWNQNHSDQLDYIKNRPFYQIDNEWNGDWSNNNAPEYDAFEDK